MKKINGNVPAAKLPKKAKDQTFKHYFPCQDLSLHSPHSEEDARYLYNFHDIDKLSELLGIPWEKSKDRPFSSSVPYIGFNWDLDNHIVSCHRKETEIC